MEKQQKIPVLIVEKIYKAYKDPENASTLQIRSNQAYSSSPSNFLSQLIGTKFTSKGRVCFQYMPNSNVAELDLEEGDDLNQKLDIPGRIVVTEINKDTYDSLDENVQKAFQPKKNPTSKEYLLDADGQYVYSKRTLGSLLEQDTFLLTGGSTKNAPDFAFDLMDLVKEEEETKESVVESADDVVI